MSCLATNKISRKERKWRFSLLRGGNGQKHRGASAVEFAIVAPIFVLFFFGIVEFGRASMARNVMINACREGARLAITNGTSASAVTTEVKKHCTAGGIKSSTVTISPTNFATAAKGTNVTVKCSVQFSSISWLPLPSYFANAQFTTSTTMRKESY